jgi:hypothetical protein
MELNLIGMSAKERWELYQIADEMGLFYELPPQPKPLAQPLVHLYQIGAQKQLWPFLQSGNPDLSDDERRACLYAWHVWRERTDVWEMPNWGDTEYDPAWLREGYSNPLLYNQFISAFELERYIVNPWVRAAAWITTINQIDLDSPPKFDTLPHASGKGSKSSKGERKHTRTARHFQYFVNQIPSWWANQKGSKDTRFEPVRELFLPSTGYVSVALRDGVTSPQPDKLIEGNWHNGYGNAIVEHQIRTCFSWTEFMWRRDELNFVIPGVIGSMLTLGPRGASWGDGKMNNKGKIDPSLWTAERKVLNRLERRVATMRRYGDALGEVAEVQRHK